MTSLKRLYLHGNEELGIPAEILGPEWDLKKEEETAAAVTNILDYYFRLGRGRRLLNELKLIVVGRGGVGKTSIIKQLLDKPFDAKEQETPGIEINRWPVTLPSGDRVRLHILGLWWQEILHATHQFFLTERTLYLLVLSGREGSQTQDAEYWLQLIKSFGGDSKVIIALNKVNQHAFDVNRELLLEKYPFIADFVKTDCECDQGVPPLRQLLLRQTDAMEYRKTYFPGGWFKIKDRLAGMAENFITWDQYQAICGKHGEQDPTAQRRLATFLHILGIALNYGSDPRLKDTHVLNPRWVTEGIYAILRLGQKETQDAVITKRDLDKFLNESRYPAQSHGFLLNLMEKFELCFRLPGREERYLIPELLGENQPDLKPLLGSARTGVPLSVRGPPPGHAAALHRPDPCAQRGQPSAALANRSDLNRDGCSAVVRGDLRDRRVDIHITGPEPRRRGLLDIIRDKFDEQHRDLKGLVFEERVPVPGESKWTASYQDLLKRERRGEDIFTPENMDHPVSVLKLLNGVDSPERQVQRSQRGPSPIWLRLPGNQVFISYSKADQKFLDELQKHWKPYERAGGIVAWSDQDIAPGSTVLKEIQAAVAAAEVAVLLVSPDFLSSDFIHEHEFGPLLQQAASGGVQVLWVPVRACAYKKTALAGYQAVSDPQKPLAQMKEERDAAWVIVCEEIQRALSSRGR